MQSHGTNEKTQRYVNDRVENCAFSFFTSPSQEKKLLKHPHKQKYTKSKVSKRQKMQLFLRQDGYAIKKKK